MGRKKKEEEPPKRKRKEKEKKTYVPTTTTKVGDVVGRVYDSSDSPIAEITMTRKGFKMTGKNTGKSVENANLRKLVMTDYLTATGGVKYVYIRWARTKNFDIMNYTKPWVDKKPHWSADKT